MCRITGFLDFNKNLNYNPESILTKMRDTLIHGGPDDAGQYLNRQKGIALAHRRLSIIDLSKSGHQPMHDETNKYTIVFNGEAYNYKEVQRELTKLGHKFRSTSDTEVVLKAYIQWGLDAIHKFRGMFAFAIWDDDKEELILCRDRVGKEIFLIFLLFQLD